MATYSITPEEPGRGPNPDEIERSQLEERTKSSALWFYSIAALSLITSIVSLSGNNWGFFASLGVTQVVDAIAVQVAQETGGAVKIVAFVFDLMAVAVFVLLGYFAAKGHTWAFIVGMVLYLLDSVVFIVAGRLLGLAFHAFVLYIIFGGYKACAALAALHSAAVASPPPPPAPTPAPGNAP